jgi:hypothetical protein
VLEVLDEAASSILRFKKGGVMMIQRYVFYAEAISGVDIFKIPNLRVSPVFFSNSFVNRWMDSGLKGVKFKKIWGP